MPDDPYSSNFDTALKGGYTIVFTYKNDEQFLLLKNGNRTIDTLNSSTIGFPYKSQGYVGADFDKAFVFVHSFGSGNPHEIEVFDKATMRNLVVDGNCWIDADTRQQYLLYAETSVPSHSDKMILYRAKNNSSIELAFPDDVFGNALVVNRIRIRQATRRSLEIEYEVSDSVKTRIYYF